MRLIVIAKLTDDSDPVEGYSDVLSFIREEVVLLDTGGVNDSADFGDAYKDAIAQGGATILEYLDAAREKIHEQIVRTNRGVDLGKRAGEEPS